MTKNIILSAVLLLVLSSIPFVSKAMSPVRYETDPRSSYRSVIDVVPASSSLPTLLEVPLPADVDYVLVHEVATGEYLSSMLDRRQMNTGATYQINLSESTYGTRNLIENLLDKNPNTTLDLLVAGSGTAPFSSFYLDASSMERVSELSIDYAPSTALPNTVSLYAIVDGREELVSREEGYNSRRMIFPERYGQAWRVVFTYDEPIRLAGLKFGPELTTTVTNAVRFLAQPGQKYSVYLYPEIFVNVTLRDSGILYGDNVVRPEFVSGAKRNMLFVEADQDEDMVPDFRDNCPADYNPDQISSRGGTRGDVCDDFDNDNIVNPEDNCPNIPNYDQRDTDGDMVGDECDKVESRITEQYPWLPWLGMGITLLVILMLFILVAKRPLPEPEREAQTTSDTNEPVQ